jgi:hypothetical protein
MGPEGPQGISGVAGPPGPTGPAGPSNFTFLRTTSPVNLTGTSFLVIPGLQANLVGGLNYAFAGIIHISSGGNLGGIAIGPAGTVAYSSFVCSGYLVSAPAGVSAYGLVLASNVQITGGTPAAATSAFINGLISVTTPGTFNLQAAQSISNATATVIAQGSTLTLWTVP